MGYFIGQAGHLKPNLSDYFSGSRFAYWSVYRTSQASVSVGL